MNKEEEQKGKFKVALTSTIKVISGKSKIDINFGNKNLRLYFDQIIEFDKNELKNFGIEYINEVNSLSGETLRTTDKLPANFLNVGFIKLILPKAKIIPRGKEATIPVIATTKVTSKPPQSEVST